MLEEEYTCHMHLYAKEQYIAFGIKLLSWLVFEVHPHSNIVNDVLVSICAWSNIELILLK